MEIQHELLLGFGLYIGLIIGSLITTILNIKYGNK